MFIRKRKGKYMTCYQVLESYRENGKVKQRIVVNLGGQPTVEKAITRYEKELAYYADMLRPGRWMPHERAEYKRRSERTRKRLEILKSLKGVVS